MTDAQIQTLVNIIDQLVVLLLPIAAAWAIRHWGVKQRVEATLARQDLVGTLARTAVRAAEQSLDDLPGEQKKEDALNWMEKQAALHGIKVTPEQLRVWAGAIEAAVREMHVGDALTTSVVKPAPPPAGTTTHDPTANKPSGAGVPL